MVHKHEKHKDPIVRCEGIIGPSKSVVAAHALSMAPKGVASSLRSGSVSHRDGGWAPLRADAPGRLRRATGRFPNLNSEILRTAALTAVRLEVYAASTRPSVKSRRLFIVKALRAWKQRPFPPTVGKIEKVAATLRYGKYRSATSYLGQYRADSERAGYSLSGPLYRSFKDMGRACNRGLGPPVRSKALPMDRLGDLPKNRRPWVPGGPISPRTALVTGA